MPNELEPTSSKPSQDEHGIILVASRITQPDRLPTFKFVDWYENVHVQEVIDTGGVPGAVRYESVSSSPDASNHLAKYQWITIYAFPSLNFRFTDQFRGLDGQKAPKKEILEGIFHNAAFATRFCGLAGWKGVSGEEQIEKQKPKQFLVMITLENVKDGQAQAIADSVGRVSGVQRVQVFEIRASTVLSEFDRTSGQTGTTILIGFDEQPDLSDVLQDLGSYGDVAEQGIFKIKKTYDAWQ